MAKSDFQPIFSRSNLVLSR